MKENIETFNSKYDFIFKKYKNKEELKSIYNGNECNFLYLFDVDYYSQNSEKLPENTCKLGMTNKPICMRLNGYPVKANIRNIEFIQCNYPDKRERLIKAFLKNKTNIVPIIGTEYYKDCRYIIKLIYIILNYIEDSDINIACNYYDKKDEKYNILFNYIYSIYEKVLIDINFNLSDNINLYPIDKIELPITVKIRNNNKSKNKCEYCNKDFYRRTYLEKHLLLCKSKLIHTSNNSSTKTKELENTISVLTLKNKELENIILMQEQQINKLKNKCFKKNNSSISLPNYIIYECITKILQSKNMEEFIKTQIPIE
jgi:hypothetical protein